MIDSIRVRNHDVVDVDEAVCMHDCLPSNSTNLHGTGNLAMLKLSI